MKQIRKYFIVMFMALLTSSAFAQLSPVDFMRYNPRASYANPATYTYDDGYFDMLLGGINIGAMNVGLKYDNFFKFNSQGYPTTLDLNQGVASLRDVNYMNTNISLDIFSCGLRTKHGYFTYTHRFREMESLTYSKDLVKLLAQGNAAFLGESNPANIDIRLATRAFQEFDFGYQMSLMDQLNIGVRLKFLMGYVDLKMDGMSMKLYTDPETYALRLTADNAIIRGTLPYEFTEDMEIVDSRFNVANLFKNYGGGIDLGAEYRFDDQWSAAAAINDLGFIVWNNHAVQLDGKLKDEGSFYQDGAFVFNGLNSEQINGIMNTEGYLEQLTDSLKNYYDYTVTNLSGYTTGLNTNFMVRGNYDLTPNHRFSAQFMGYNMGLGIQPAFTVAYTGSFAKRYDVVATYTMMKGSFDNIGIGLSANFGGILLYVASNNVLGFFNPANRTQIHAQLGISFTSGQMTDRSETIIMKDKANEENLEE